MDRSKLPVAKRTRLACDNFLYERYLKEKARPKKAKTSGAGVPVPEADVVTPINGVDVGFDEGDERLSGVRKCESSKSKKCGRESKNGKNLEKDCHAIDNNDVVEVLDSSDDDDDDGEDESLSDEETDSDVMVMSVIEKGEGNEDKRMVNDDNGDVKEDRAMDLEVSDSSSADLEFSDSSSSEDCSEESNESYVGDDSCGSDHAESSDESSSYAKSEDEDLRDETTYEGKADSDDNEIECSYREKNDVKCKGKGMLVEGGQRENKNDERNYENGKRSYSVDDDSDEENIGNFKNGRNDKRNDENGKRSYYVGDDTDEENGRNVERKTEERTVKSGLKKRTESQNVADHLHSRSVEKIAREKVNSRKDGQPIPEAEEVVGIFSSSESDNESRGKCVKRDGGEPQKYLKMAIRRKEDEYLDGLKILGDSLCGKGEALKNFEKEKPKYKFWFKDEEERLVEKTDFDKHLDDLFEELNMCLTSEQIGYTPLEVDNGDRCKKQTDWATLCSQGTHHLVLDEQIGIICKYCSHVHQEIKHILPDFSKPSSQSRRRGYFVQSGCPIYSDYFRDTGAAKHDFGNYNTTGTVWDLVPGTRSSMYQHQREGFEFIWKNLAGGIIIEELEKSLSSSSGSGCIISHAPGTGKTRLTIVFLQSFMKMYPDSRPVIIAPKSMLLTWEEEFKKWNINIPFHNMNKLEFSGQENPAAVSVLKKIRSSRNNENVTRVVKLLSWKMDKSILGITYALFDKLVGGATRNADCTPIVKQMGEALLKLPSLIVLDEGHTPRNDQSCLYNSLLDVETERRIILSGTPFQNNFNELYNTLRLVNPKFDRKSSKFDGGLKKSLRKISKELKSKWSGHKLRELKGMISPFVHVHKGKILQKNCPGLKDALIRLQPTDLQQELIALLRTNEMITGYLELLYVISLVSVHPSLLPERCFQEHQFSAYRDKLARLKSDPHSGAKTKFVVELCRLSEALNERVLVYSQFIDPLIFIKEQLQTYFGWTEGREVLYMDGSLEARQRQSSITSLNDPRSKARVLLASIKACSEGIHLVGASRVVLLDVVWNPSVERQAISRAYRLGQKKIVYTYHLIGEEMEIQKYKIQTAKDQLSEMVFSSNDMDGCKENMPDIVSEDQILQEMFRRNDKLGGMFKQILYQPKESNLVDTFDLVAEELN